MRKHIVYSVALFIFLLGAAGPSWSGTLSEVRQAVEQKGAPWVAAETKVSQLPAAEFKKRLGLRFPDASAAQPAAAALETPLAGLPGRLDWRNNGGNFVTGIRDQGNCGSCWAFATTAALESATLIANRSPGIDLNLSEQIMLSCSGAGDCENGGYVQQASDFIRDQGLPLEPYYAYLALDGICNDACASWTGSPPYRITSWSYAATTSPSASALKNALNTYGPLATTFQVYDDFRYYTSGVYSYTSGQYLGGHAVLLVGYDDPGQYFIVKNSWGPDWGEAGYFRIAYSQVTNAVHFGQWTISYSGIAAPMQAMNVSAASYSCKSLPAESIDAVFGPDLATTTEAAAAVPLPTTLGGTTVKVRDARGVERPAPLFFVSPSQVNYEMPEGTAAGTAMVTITSGSGHSVAGAAYVESVGPGVFSANADGKGVAAASIIRVKADGSQAWEPVARYDEAQKKSVPIPIDLGPATDKVYLVLFATGVRFRSDLSAVSAKIGDMPAAVSYAGKQGYYVGLDQVNVLLPRSLAGRGEVDVVLTVDGKQANKVTVTLR